MPAAPYHTLESLVSDPHLEDSGFFQRIEHPTEGAIWELQPANRMYSGMRQDGLPAPRMGQHTREVLAEAGLSAQEIASLIHSQAAMQWTDDAEVGEMR